MVSLAIPTKSVKISLSEEQYKQLQKLADEQHESVASLIREALSYILENKIPQKTDTDESRVKQRLRDHEAFGIWADRDEMIDSAEWIRKQRENWKERIDQSEKCTDI
jgi:hypothetical protein